MLGKLIKYDLKAMNRYLVVIHLMLLITALIGRFVAVSDFLEDPGKLSSVGAIMIGFGILLFIALCMAAVFGTLAIVGIHFYKNLFSDEGYITLTLPVSKGCHLAAKTISGSIWLLIDQMLVMGSIGILVLVKPVIEMLTIYGRESLTEMGFPQSFGIGSMVLVVAALGLVSAVINTATLYVSVVLGQLFGNHRVLGALVMYFCINTLMSLIIGVISTGAGFIGGISAHPATVFQVYVKLFSVSSVLELLFAAMFYVVSYILMKRRLNLN